MNFERGFQNDLISTMKVKPEYRSHPINSSVAGYWYQHCPSKDSLDAECISWYKNSFIVTRNYVRQYKEDVLVLIHINYNNKNFDLQSEGKYWRIL